MKVERNKKEMTVVELARMGGLARAKKLTKQRLREISRLAGSAPKSPRRPSRKICLHCHHGFIGQTSRKWCGKRCEKSWRAANKKRKPA